MKTSVTSSLGLPACVVAHTWMGLELGHVELAG